MPPSNGRNRLHNNRRKPKDTNHWRSTKTRPDILLGNVDPELQLLRTVESTIRAFTIIMRPGEESPYHDMTLRGRAREYCEVLVANSLKFYDSPMELSSEVDAVVGYTEEESEVISACLDWH